MTLLWSDGLLVGNELIDKQHRELIHRIGSFLNALESGIGKEDIVKILEFLSEYVVEHFSNEEDLMMQYHYPEYEMHRREHSKLELVLSVLKKKVEEKGVTVELVAQTHQTVYEWLKKHIHERDKNFAAFIKNKAKSAKS
jgi:hemerythrin